MLLPPIRTTRTLKPDGCSRFLSQGTQATPRFKPVPAPAREEDTVSCVAIVGRAASALVWLPNRAIGGRGPFALTLCLGANSGGVPAVSAGPALLPDFSARVRSQGRRQPGAIHSSAFPVHRANDYSGAGGMSRRSARPCGPSCVQPSSVSRSSYGRSSDRSGGEDSSHRAISGVAIALLCCARQLYRRATAAGASWKVGS